MQNKNPTIIIAVLSALALGLGYWVGLPKEGSGGGRGNGDPKEPDFLKQGLVAYYPFNGNAKDESGNGYDGKISGTTLTKDRHGNAEKAYDFDGVDDYITLPSSIFEEVDGFTLSTWVSLDSISQQHFILSGATHEDDNRFHVCLWDGVFTIYYRNQPHPCFSSRILMGRWKHVVVATTGIQNVDNDSGQLTGQLTFIVYVDGLLQAKTGFLAKGQLRFASGGLMIGPDQDDVGGGFERGQFLKGAVDDYRIYNRALSAAEVKELYEFEKVK